MTTLHHRLPVLHERGTARPRFPGLGKAALFLLLALSGAIGTGAFAQGYPHRAVKILVGYPPGGAHDFVARTVGQALSLWNTPEAYTEKIRRNLRKFEQVVRTANIQAN